MKLSYKRFTFGYTFGDDKEVISLIFINYFIILLFGFVLVLLHTSEEELYPVSYRYHGLVGTGFLSILLIRLRLITLVKYILMIVPAISLLLLPPLAGLFDNEFYFWFPYAPTALSIIPHFILKPGKERVVKIAILTFYFVLVVLNDNLMTYLGGSVLPVTPIIEEHSFYYNLIPIFIFIFVNLALGLLFRQNAMYEEVLKKQQSELNVQNQKLSQQKEALVAKNRELDHALKELHDAQSQLIQTEKLASLGTLAAGIAHELNNPLNFVSVSVEEIADRMEKMRQLGHPDPKAMEDMRAAILEYLDYAREGTARSVEIVSKLGSLKSRESRNRDNVSLADLVNDTIGSMSQRIPETMRLECNIPDELQINCQKSKIQKAIASILDNAVEALNEEKGGSSGMIWISAGKQKIDDVDYIVLSIANNGPPVAEDNREKVFDPFFTTKSCGRYPGLGLSLVYSIMKEHSGKVTLDAMEKRTVFSLFFPVHAT